MTSRCLVMLPGLMCDDAVWQHQRRALPGVQCHVPDYGMLSSLTDMVQLVLDTAPADTFALAGHSMGGRVAMEVCRLAPQRVERLALLDTGMDPIAAGEAGEAERQKRMNLLAMARQQGMREMGKVWVTGMVHPDVLGTPLHEAILDMIERKTADIFAAQIEALLSRPNARGVLQALTCPVMFLCGRQDAWSPLSRHAEMQALVPGSALVAIEDSGHMSTMEQPDAVSQAFAKWLVAA
jgi:pimeloyl-ACP methyl ester carboxylesterase